MAAGNEKLEYQTSEMNSALIHKTPNAKLLTIEPTDSQKQFNNNHVIAKHAKTPEFLKYLSLVLLTLQNAALILVMRHVRTRPGDMFFATCAVVMSELFKLLTSLAIVFYEKKTFNLFLGHLYENIILQPVDCLKVSVPSIAYVIQNYLMYVAVSNLDAATFQVLYQLKILTTALMSVVMLHKRLSALQWMSLFVLFAGVSIVQQQSNSAPKKSVSAVEQDPIKGLIVVCVACMLSGFAGVYFEKILKGTSQSVWLRNVQLGALGTVIALVTVAIQDGDKVAEKGFFFGFHPAVWLVVCLHSFGGLVVAVVVKYADNILKGFGSSAAIVLSCVASMFFFDFQLTWQFTIGAGMVILAVYMYSTFVPKPQEPTPKS